MNDGKDANNLGVHIGAITDRVVSSMHCNLPENQMLRLCQFVSTMGVNCYPVIPKSALFLTGSQIRYCVSLCQNSCEIMTFLRTLGTRRKSHNSRGHMSL